MPSEIVIHLFPLLLATCASAAFLDTFVQPATPKPEGSEYVAEPVSLLSLSQETAKTVEPSGAIAGDSQSYASLWLNAHALLLWQFFASLTFTGLVKVLCVTGNVLVQVSPFPQVKRWEKRGDTGGADSAPYVSIAFGGWQWCFYGVFAWLVTGRTGFLILLQSNSLGAVLGSYYTYAFYRQCQSEQARSYLQRYLSFVAGLAFFEACTTAVLPAERALFLVGLVSAFCVRLEPASSTAAMGVVDRKLPLTPRGIIPHPEVAKLQHANDLHSPRFSANEVMPEVEPVQLQSLTEAAVPWSPRTLAAKLRRAIETAVPDSPPVAASAVVTPRGLQTMELPDGEDVPVPRTPRGADEALATPRAGEAAAAVAAEGAAAVEGALQEFADFWEDSGSPRTPRRRPSGGDPAAEFSIATPVRTPAGTPRRGRSRQKMQLFYVGTPRGQSPASPRKEEEQRYVPEWPFWGTGVAPTTLELRGLPASCCNEVIIAQLNDWGFAGRYNFVHTPLDCNFQCYGGAVINTVRHADGVAIAGRLHGFRGWTSSGQGRPCRVSWYLQLQGLDSLFLEHQMRPDGSALGPYFLLGDQWACMPQPCYQAVGVW